MNPSMAQQKLLEASEKLDGYIILYQREGEFRAGLGGLVEWEQINSDWCPSIEDAYMQLWVEISQDKDIQGILAR